MSTTGQSYDNSNGQRVGFSLLSPHLSHMTISSIISYFIDLSLGLVRFVGLLALWLAFPLWLPLSLVWALCRGIAGFFRVVVLNLEVPPSSAFVTLFAPVASFVYMFSIGLTDFPRWVSRTLPD